MYRFDVTDRVYERGPAVNPHLGVTFVTDPVRWLRTISEKRATISAAPSFAFSLCLERIDDAELVGVNLSSWRVALNGAEFRLLAILLAHPSRVLSRSQLMELLRGRDADPFDRSIDVRISRLRQILRDDARGPRIIKTVHGEGYVIGVLVERA